MIVRSLLLTARNLLFQVQKVQKVQKVQPVFVSYIGNFVCNYMTDVQCDTNILSSCSRYKPCRNIHLINLYFLFHFVVGVFVFSFV